MRTIDIQHREGFVWFLKLDQIDKALWQELYRNCRQSYQYLADKLGITPNAVRKRIEKLMESGVIVEWILSFTPAMIDSCYSFVEVSTTDERHQGIKEGIIKNLPLALLTSFTFVPIITLINYHIGGTIKMTKSRITDAYEIAWNAIRNDF